MKEPWGLCQWQAGHCGVPAQAEQTEHVGGMPTETGPLHTEERVAPPFSMYTKA
jgi:hypothetical protein